MASTLQAQMEGRSRERSHLTISIPDPETFATIYGRCESPLHDKPLSPFSEKQNKFKAVVLAKGKRLPRPPETPPSTMATILSMDSSVKENCTKERNKEKKKEESLLQPSRRDTPKVSTSRAATPGSSSTPRATATTPKSSTPKSSTPRSRKSASKEWSNYQRAKVKDRIIREICIKAANRELNLDNRQWDDQEEASEASRYLSKLEGGENAKNLDTLEEKSTLGTHDADDSTNPSDCEIIRPPTPVKMRSNGCSFNPTGYVNPTGSVITIPSPHARNSPSAASPFYELQPLPKSESTPLSPQNGDSAKLLKPSPKSGPMLSLRRFVESPRGTTVFDKATCQTFKKGGGKNGQPGDLIKRAFFKSLSVSTQTTNKGGLESDAMSSPSMATTSNNESSPSDNLVSSNLYGDVASVTSPSSTSLRQSSMETEAANNLSGRAPTKNSEPVPAKTEGIMNDSEPGEAKIEGKENDSEPVQAKNEGETYDSEPSQVKTAGVTNNSEPGPAKIEGILKNKGAPVIDGSFLALPQLDHASLSAPSEQDRELQLGRDMVILSEAFHLDRNTQSLLAQYDARTVEDFCLMTTEDLEKLVKTAAESNRPLPPLQVRKLQVLREWAQNLADQSMREAEMSVICQCAADIANDHVYEQSSNLIPKDWAKQFREDLPRLKQTLKERGGKTAAAMSWFSSYFSFPSMYCGPM
jgi:hypothetical protein